MRVPPIVALAAAVALLPVAAACGGTDGGSAGCGPVVREALDPQFLVHVLGGAEVRYTTDPPTSGPHQPSPTESGVQAQALSRPIQVGVLEGGSVLLQHRPDLPADQLATLESLAGEHVVVAPNPDLDDPVVATAWLYKRTCATVDADALREFVADREGHGPGTP